MERVFLSMAAGELAAWPMAKIQFWSPSPQFVGIAWRLQAEGGPRASPKCIPKTLVRAPGCWV